MDINLHQNTINKDDRVYECCGIKYKIPQPYSIRNGAICEVDTTASPPIYKPIILRPAFITAICKNIDTGNEKVEITLEKKSQKLLVDKSTLYSRNKIIQLADKGMQVTSLNATVWIQFLSDLEVLNEEVIPSKIMISHLGWVDNQTFIPYKKGNYDLDIDDNISVWTNALTEKGDLNVWIEEFSKLRNNPIFRFILATSFTAPLLKITNSRNFVIYNWGNSKRWKISSCLLCYVCLGTSRQIKSFF